jgi:hypothetical protein
MEDSLDTSSHGVNINLGFGIPESSAAPETRPDFSSGVVPIDVIRVKRRQAPQCVFPVATAKSRARSDLADVMARFMVPETFSGADPRAVPGVTDPR